MSLQNVLVADAATVTNLRIPGGTGTITATTGARVYEPSVVPTSGIFVQQTSQTAFDASKNVVVWAVTNGAFTVTGPDAATFSYRIFSP